MKTFRKLAVLMMAVCTLCSCTKEEAELTGTIYGKITNLSGEILPSVTMTLSPGGVSRTTGSDGTFEMTDLEPGQYTLQAQKSGYKTNTKTVRIVAGQTASGDMVLTPVSNEADITIAPDYLNFGSTQTQMAVTIKNNGNATTSWTVDLGKNNWLEASPAQGSIAAGKQQIVTFSVDRDKISDNKNVIISISANGSTYPITVNCAPAGAKEAEMNVSPKVLDFGSTTDKLGFEIKNTGEANLYWNTKGLTEAALSLSAEDGVVAPGGTSLVYVQVDRSLVTADIQTSFIVTDGTKDEAITVKVSKSGNGGNENGGEDNPGGETGEIVVPEGLYVYYPFNGDYNDVTENQMNGFGQNNPTFVEGITETSQAIKFSRTDNSAFNVPYPIFDTEEMSLCFWGKDFSDGNIFYSVNSKGYAIHTLSMYQNSLKYVASPYYVVYVYESTGQLSHPVLTDGKWHHIALTSDYNRTSTYIITTKLYVDGNLVDVITQNADTYGNGGVYGDGIKFIFGGSATYGSKSINGTNMSIDNLRVYNTRSLSAQEVKAIYDAKQ